VYSGLTERTFYHSGLGARGGDEVGSACISHDLPL
jgi:hypothetical protein